MTGGLAKDWQLTFLAPADEASIVPVSAWPVLPGVPFLTDLNSGRSGGPGRIAARHPPLQPISEIGWPVALLDAPGPAYDAPWPPAEAPVASASDSARTVAARRATPASIRSGVGAENDRRRVFCPSPLT